MQEFYFDIDFHEQSKFDFEHYEYLFGGRLQPDEDGRNDEEEAASPSSRQAKASYALAKQAARAKTPTLVHFNNSQPQTSTRVLKPPERGQLRRRNLSSSSSTASTERPPSRSAIPILANRRGRSRDPSPCDYSETNGSVTAPELSQHMDKPKGSSLTRGSGLRKSFTGSSRAGASGGAGAVDEEAFVQAFEQVPRLQFFSGKEVAEVMGKIREVLNGSVEEWEKRVDKLRVLRSLVLAGAAEHEEFWTNLRALELPFQNCVSDLRSLVVREACITAAYLSVTLKNKFDHFAENILTQLLGLIANSTKIMSSSGILTLRFVLKHTHAPRLLPLLVSFGTSKSNIQRRYLCDFLLLVFNCWPTHCLEKHLAPLQDALKRGLVDADQDARAISRKAFWAFYPHFKPQAESILKTLEPKVRSQVEKEKSGCDTETLGNNTRAPAAIRKAMPRSTSDHNALGTRTTASAVARARPAAVEQTPRGRAPTKTVSQSTPASREVSPTSRQNYITYQNANSTTKPSRIPRSERTSREGSPGRSGIPVPAAVTASLPRRRASAGLMPRRPSSRGAGQILPNDQAAQQALSDALQYKLNRPKFDGDSDDDTSSVCSDVSLRSFTNLAEIVHQLQSAEWDHRRDGLASFVNYLTNGNQLNESEVKKISEIFSRLFNDNNSRVIQFFLDALSVFVSHYHAQLHDWLYIVLIKLINRLANETLVSQQTRFQAALDRVQGTFPMELQLTCLFRYIIDQTQMPPPKVKVTLLRYMQQLVAVMPSDAFQFTPEAKLALSRLTMWTHEPKSPDVRKQTQIFLTALFDLNTAVFSAILQTMPTSIQQRATTVLDQQIKLQQERRPSISSAHRQNGNAVKDLGLANAENISPEEISSYIRQTAEDIRSLTNEHHRTTETTRRPFARDTSSADSGIQDPELEDPYRFPGHGKQVRGRTDPDGPLKLRNHYAAEEEDDEEDDFQADDAISEILRELSNHNERNDQRKACMLKLVKMVRENAVDNWDEHFKTILLILVETLGDDSSEIRVDALAVLQELLRAQPLRFAQYLELTVLRTFEAHKDQDKGVVKAAEEMARCIASSIPADQCLRVLLATLNKNPDDVTTTAAIKMEMRVIQEAPTHIVERFLTELTPGLVRGCDHRDSPVRKAAIFALVQVYLKVGEVLLNHVNDLSNSKKRLLQLYIHRAKENASEVAAVR